MRALPTDEPTSKLVSMLTRADVGRRVEVRDGRARTAGVIAGVGYSTSSATITFAADDDIDEATPQDFPFTARVFFVPLTRPVP